jgi:hypothetical protein
MLHRHPWFRTEAAVMVILSLLALALVSGCDFSTLTPSQLESLAKDSACGSQADCKRPNGVNQTTVDFIFLVLALFGMPIESSGFHPLPAAPSSTPNGIKFEIAATLPFAQTNASASETGLLFGYRQSDGTYTAQGLRRANTTTTYVGALPGVQDYFALASGVPTRTPNAHGTLLADQPGASSMPAIATKLAGSAPYAMVFATLENKINVSQGAATVAGISFTSYALDAASISVLAADFNGDGRRDIAALTGRGSATAGSVAILLGNTDGTLQAAVNYPAGILPNAMTAFDFNGDGKLDLAIANRGDGSDPKTGTVSILLGNGNGTFRTGATYQIPPLNTSQMQPYTIVAADFDADGKTDVMVSAPHKQGLTLLHGNGDGTFQVLAAKTGYALPYDPTFTAAGDLNKDGKPDLVTINLDGTVSALINAGDGSFSTIRRYVAGNELANGVYAAGAFVADFNDDGNLDIIVATGHPDALISNPMYVTVLFGKGDGSFYGAAAQESSPSVQAVAFGDFNKDGIVDMVVGSDAFGTTSGIRVLLGKAGGGYQAPLNITGTYRPDWLGVADMNGDGLLDLVAQAYSSVSVWAGKGDGTFQSATTISTGSAAISSVAIGDLNGDARPDIVVSRGQTWSTTATDSLVILAKSGGGFNSPVALNAGQNTVALALADLNGDGKLDLAAANYGFTGSAPSAGKISILLGKGDGTFQTPVNYTAAQNPGTLAVADVNGDGKLDLVAGTTTGTDCYIAVLPGNGSGGFGAAVTTGIFSQPVRLLVLDLDRDGKPDVLTSHQWDDAPFVTMRGNGDGTFGKGQYWLAGHGSKNLAAADLTGDGKAEVAVTSVGDGGDGYVAIYRNTSTGGLSTVNTTIATSPAGLSVVVDGATVSAPRTYTWLPGETHTIGAASPQTGSTARYNFSSWSDSGTPSHTITVPSGDSTFTATFTATQYLLSTAVSPSAGGAITAVPSSSDGYYNVGTSVQLTANAASGYTFSSWSGDISGATNPQSIVMSAARSVTAAFSGGVVGTGLRFVPVTPCRIADTRNATGTFGGPTMSGGSTRSFPIPQSSCSIPATAAAYSLNVTVVPQGGLGYLSIWPTGSAQPLVSTLNSGDGRIKANAAIVPAGTSGAISVYVTDRTEVVLDINGYFTSASASGLAFYPVTPCRIADTRNATGAFGGPSLAAGGSRTFNLPQSSCSIPATATAYSLNFTAVPRSGLGYLSTWPAGSSQPLVSTLNSPLGTVVANAAIVPAGTSGGINVYVTDTSDLVIDINGYFAPPGSGGYYFYTVNPCRVLDTRNAAGTFGGPIIAAGTSRSFPLPTSACSLPATATGYSLNVTVVPAAGLGYLTLWPAGGTQPFVSTLNAPDGSITANAALVPSGGSGGVSVFVLNNTHVILDVNGYFAP